MKFYPDYFSFPNNDDFQQADNGDPDNNYSAIPNNPPQNANQIEQMQQMGQPGGIVADQNQEMYAGMNMGAQETCMETLNQNGYGLESGSQFGSPMKGGGRGMEEETY